MKPETVYYTYRHSIAIQLKLRTCSSSRKLGSSEPSSKLIKSSTGLHQKNNKLQLGIFFSRFHQLIS